MCAVRGRTVGENHYVGARVEEDSVGDGPQFFCLDVFLAVDAW